MTSLADFLGAVNGAGLRLASVGGRLRLVGPPGALTPEIKAGAVEHRAAILSLLARGNGAAAPPEPIPASEGLEAAQPVEDAAVTIGGRDYPYRRRWWGDSLLPPDGYLAFDTETEVVNLRRAIPRLALASASAGDRDSCLVHPDDIGGFVLAHRDLHLICHNAAFDFWAVEDHLRRRGEEEARRAWWEIAETNRLHDSMLLDMLVRLARDDSFPESRNLAVVAKHYAGLDVDKADPYRLRYGEIIGRDWGAVEDGFFSYAIKDAVVTRPTYLAIRRQALALADEFDRHGSDVLPDARERFGLLTESVQVKKAIALAQVTRNGMCLDRPLLEGAEGDLRRRLADAVACVRELCPGLYKTDKNGALVHTRAGAPSRSNKVLVEQLETLAEQIKQETGVVLSVPLTAKTRKPSTSNRYWEEYAELHPFLGSWVEAEELAKQLQFFTHLRDDRVHPSYTTLVRSGRTSCREPNVQQIPRDGPLRRAFVASPGHFLPAVDYSFIELRTLAATALHRYGQSDLADVIKAGVDPHAHTAALMLGEAPDEFLTWKTDERRQDEYARARQAAKAVNFGVPGGLGVASLVGYARRTYGVPLTFDEARERRERLTKRVYKELDLYLAEDGAATVARNLRAPLQEARDVLGDLRLSCIRKVLTGEPKRLDGQPYKASFVDRVWTALAELNRNPELKDDLENQRPSPALAARVCQAGVATLTGRIRGRVRYSQARNTPFQGLAADGAALALFALVKEGFRVVGFIHDEVLVELPDEGGFVAEAQVRRVEEILCREMAGVLVGDIPVACEAALARRWEKKAKRVARDGKVFPWQAGTAEPLAEVSADLGRPPTQDLRLAGRPGRGQAQSAAQDPVAVLRVQVLEHHGRAAGDRDPEQGG
jgi:hypothetical protein